MPGSSPSAILGALPCGVRARCCSLPRAAGAAWHRPAPHFLWVSQPGGWSWLTWRLGSSSRKTKGLPKRRWRAAFVVSFSDLNFSCTKRGWS